MRKRRSRALVGGLGGIAWEIGYLAGLGDAGVDPRDVDLILGTSAGAVMAVQLASGTPLELLYGRQVEPSLQSPEVHRPLKIAELAERLRARPKDPLEAGREAGAMARRAQTISEAERRTIVEGRLPARDWPATRLAITAVDCETGALVVFDAASGVSLLDAVAASTAIPGVWPPATIAGRHYIDGGIQTLENADLAIGHDRVLILQPLPLPGIDTLTAEREMLHAAGAQTYVATPDAAAAAAIGPDPLDPAIRSAAAAAGRDQGRREGDAVARLWAR
jgi:NTE family protein